MKRILFVDDDRDVLEGLRAMLRDQHKRWDMVFVAGGEEAIAELERSRIDVIVCDMRMPRIDGATLLRHVQDRHPRVVRIVLSGYAELESALRTVPVAHQFLTKPCDAELLRNVVDRACNLQALIGDETIRDLIGKLGKLPSLPRVYLQLTHTLADENAGTDEVARVIEGDPSMCAKVLQLVNSAFIGLGRQITSIEQAVAYLGTNMLKNLTLVVKVFSVGNGAAGAILDRLQGHALLVAAIARRLAGADRRLAEDAFISGILHDLGKLILASERPHQFEHLAERARTEGRPLFAVEREELGVTHAEMGAYLLGIWGLPYPIVEAVANHHAPERVPARQGLDPLATTYLANLFVHEQAAERGESAIYPPLDQAYLDAIGVSESITDWREMAASLAAGMRANPDRRAA